MCLHLADMPDNDLVETDSLCVYLLDRWAGKRHALCKLIRSQAFEVDVLLQPVVGDEGVHI